MRITWKCDNCGELIADGDGYITLDRRAAHDAERSANQRRCTEALTIVDWATVRPPVQWEVLHERCDEEIERPDYWFGVDRARTLADMLNWSAHLSEKRWHHFTDWHRFLQKSLSGYEVTR